MGKMWGGADERVLKLSCNLNGSFNKHVLVNYIDKNLFLSISVAFKLYPINFPPKWKYVNVFCQFRISQIANKTKIAYNPHNGSIQLAVYRTNSTADFSPLSSPPFHSLLMTPSPDCSFCCYYCHFLYLRIWKRAIILSVFLICWLTNKYKLIARKKKFDKIYSWHSIISDGLFYLRFLRGEKESVWSLHKTMTCV